MSYLVDNSGKGTKTFVLTTGVVEDYGDLYASLVGVDEIVYQDEGGAFVCGVGNICYNTPNGAF